MRRFFALPLAAALLFPSLRAEAAPGVATVTKSTRVTRISVYLEKAAPLTGGYRVWTSALSAGSDTVVRVLDASNKELAMNDDCAGAGCPDANVKASSVSFSPPSDGWYTVVVHNHTNNRQGDTATLKIDRNELFLAIPPATGGWKWVNKHTYNAIPVGGTKVALATWPATRSINPPALPSLAYPVTKTLYASNVREDVAASAAGEATRNDVVLYVMKGGKVDGYDDDSGSGLTPKLVSGGGCASGCYALVGAYPYSSGSEGKARLVHDETQLGGDPDGDGLSSALEAALGTSSAKRDTDGDGLEDDTEVLGRNSVVLPFDGADPKVKDVFIELDYMANQSSGGAPYFFSFRNQVIDRLRASFTQHGAARFHLHVDDQIPYTQYINNEPPGAALPANTTSFAELEDDGWFSADRAGIYRWAIAGYQYTGGGGSSGYAYAGDRFVVTLGNWTGGGNANQYTGTTIHELGHTMGLSHNGNGNNNGNNSQIHRSVMNYRYQTAGAPTNLVTDSTWRFATDAATCLTAQQAQSSPKQACINNPTATCDCTFNEWSKLDYTGGGLITAGLLAEEGKDDAQVGIGGRIVALRSDTTKTFSKASEQNLRVYRAERLDALRAREAQLLPAVTLAKQDTARVSYLRERGWIEGQDFRVVNGKAVLIESDRAQ